LKEVLTRMEGEMSRKELRERWVERIEVAARNDEGRGSGIVEDGGGREGWDDDGVRKRRIDRSLRMCLSCSKGVRGMEIAQARDACRWSSSGRSDFVS
jgi:hypothetical protein